MMYLSRVPQHELRKRAGKTTDSPDERHRDVMSIFGDLEGTPRKDAGILFRLERLPNQVPAYLVRSSVPPQNPTASTETRIEKSVIPDVGSVVGFRLSVNAVQRLKEGKIRPVLPDGVSADEGIVGVELGPWLAAKLGPGLTEVAVLNHQREILGKTRGGRTTSKTGKVIQVDTVDGVAKVGDSDALKVLLETGVGRAKAYGCGLLTIRQV